MTISPLVHPLLVILPMRPLSACGCYEGHHATSERASYAQGASLEKCAGGGGVCDCVCMHVSVCVYVCLGGTVGRNTFSSFIFERESRSTTCCTQHTNIATCELAIHNVDGDSPVLLVLGGWCHGRGCCGGGCGGGNVSVCLSVCVQR